MYLMKLKKMLYRRLGKSDLKASVIGLGTGQFGARAWGYGVKYNDDDIMILIRTAIEHGINVFDTAETYGDGISETLLGKALKDYDRDDFVVITKVAPWNLRYKNVIKAAERSLKRLGLKTIDLYLIHYPNPLIPIRETFRALEDLVKIGKVRYIGVSNFGKKLLEKAQNNLSSEAIVANEIEYNILSRRAEIDTIPYCKVQNIAIIAYSPLAGGILTGRYSIFNPPRDRARAFNFYAKRGFLKKTETLFRVLRELAENKGASISQIALSFIIHDPAFIAIPAALSQEQVIENADSHKIVLTQEETSKIRESAPTIDIGAYLFDNYIIRPISWTKATVKHLI